MNNNAQFNPVLGPQVGTLNASNHLLGDRKALNEAWARDGYWYFKDVLDKDAIAAMRAAYFEYLQRHGLMDKGVKENRYNGSGFEGKEINEAELSRISEFNYSNLHEHITKNPKVNATMKELLGDDPFWLPIAEYRANPPSSDSSAPRLIYPHQDGFYSRGLEMKICWIPMDTVTREMGGCAWVEGSHNGPLLHDMSNPPQFPIRPEQIPQQGWKSAEFEAGDIVIFDLNLLHSGFTNLTKDQFRLSMDIRVTGASGKTPSIGGVVKLSEDSVTVLNQQTKAEDTFRIVSDTYVRGTNGRKREGAEIPATFKMGETVLVNSEDGEVATLVRSIH